MKGSQRHLLYELKSPQLPLLGTPPDASKKYLCPRLSDRVKASDKKGTLVSSWGRPGSPPGACRPSRHD